MSLSVDKFVKISQEMTSVIGRRCRNEKEERHCTTHSVAVTATIGQIDHHKLCGPLYSELGVSLKIDSKETAKTDEAQNDGTLNEAQAPHKRWGKLNLPCKSRETDGE